MLNLQAVAVLSKVGSRMVNVKLDAIPICDREAPSRKFERRLERNPSSVLWLVAVGCAATRR